ncbi:hypothetical protein G6011_04081 [Alternaria panax]|uniref:Nicotianamine synthase n=1 Tax=Alternaria panax TaxID=48097 RepID=A0AAD4NS49_9PLEO|nr:hypothetical protein G6011_04081 [Alternaria panax]
MATIERKPTTEASKPTSPVDAVLTVTPPVTPNTTSSAAHQLVSEIRNIYTVLSEISSLAPSDQVNSLLTRLVNLCVVPYSAEFTAYFFRIPGIESLCSNLRPLCSEAEGELERFWAKHMINHFSTRQQRPSSVLQTFPYYQNYVDLSRLECATIEAFLPTPPTKIAFIGSGPLPLTSLCFLNRYPDAHVHNVDRDASALFVSERLCKTMGYYDERMSFACEDITLESTQSEPGWQSCEVIFLAALVGTDTHTKLTILKSMARKLAPGTLVVARSAQGMRSVLYPILELSDDLQSVGFEILAEVHPWTKVVNSIVVLRVEERE